MEDDLFQSEVRAEGASVHIPIAQTNVGFRMLQRLGWSEGKGLGKGLRGRVEPIPFGGKVDVTGLGRMKMETDILKKTTENRRLLDTEIEQTEEVLATKKAKVERETEIAQTVQEMNKVFRCTTCNKQYLTTKEWDNHLSSYDHHHNKRLKELKQRDMSRRNAKSRKKERKNEEKEFARMQQFMQQQQAKLAQEQQQQQQQERVYEFNAKYGRQLWRQGDYIWLDETQQWVYDPKPQEQPQPLVPTQPQQGQTTSTTQTVSSSSIGGGFKTSSNLSSGGFKSSTSFKVTSFGFAKKKPLGTQKSGISGFKFKSSTSSSSSLSSFQSSLAKSATSATPSTASNEWKGVSSNPHATDSEDSRPSAGTRQDAKDEASNDVTAADASQEEGSSTALPQHHSEVFKERMRKDDIKKKAKPLSQFVSAGFEGGRRPTSPRS